MQLTPSDPDIETLLGRVKSGDLNLQPEFQRGEVWSQEKKHKLIDTILRNWHVPPIHIIVVKESGKQEVLDGQQRLVAIRDFMRGEFAVNGSIQPPDDKISALANLKYMQLPDKVRKAFNNYAIRIFKISDYEPGEPAELFYRLNQPTNLTAAEKRNAFFGPARQQIKALKQLLDSAQINDDFLGFTNSRMAFEDVLAKTCLTVERRSLTEKVSSYAITDKFRSKESFDESAYTRVSEAIKLLSGSKQFIKQTIRFNKATLFSWLIFCVRLADQKPGKPLEPELCSTLGGFIESFESARWLVKQDTAHNNPSLLRAFGKLQPERCAELLRVFNDRSSSRVSDVSSVVARDLILWICFLSFASASDHSSLISRSVSENIARLWSVSSGVSFVPDSILISFAEKVEWGRAL